MKKFLFSAALILIFSFFAVNVISAASPYGYYIVDTLDDGNLDSCYLPDQKCSLNSALKVAEDSATNTVLEIKIPYQNITGLNNINVDAFPFYFVHENQDGGGIWKAYPAPVVSSADLTNLKEDITDYFVTLNTGILQAPNKDTFLTTLFFGQFKKFYPETINHKGDYDIKSPIYRIIQLPFNNLEFKSTQEVQAFIKNISSQQLTYQKIFLNGWTLRIYEESFSRAIFLIIFLLTLLVVLLNLLVFPNILVYLFVLTQDRSKSKTIGVVYNKETGEPISFASMRIFTLAPDGEQRFLKQTISDLDGKYYGFPLNNGKYILKAERGDYLDFEQTVEIFENEGVASLDIALSKISSENRKAVGLRFKDYLLSNIKKVNKWAIGFSLIIAILNIILAQNLFNVFILILAAVQFIVYWWFSRKRYWGLVLDGATNLPIKTAFVKVFNPGDYQQLDVRLTDEAGRFGFILRKEEYLINVKAFGYGYPSPKDSNSRINSPSGEVFIKLTVPKNKKINLIIYMQKLGEGVKII